MSNNINMSNEPLPDVKVRDETFEEMSLSEFDVIIIVEPEPSDWPLHPAGELSECLDKMWEVIQLELTTYQESPQAIIYVGYDGAVLFKVNPPDCGWLSLILNWDDTMRETMTWLSYFMEGYRNNNPDNKKVAVLGSHLGPFNEAVFIANNTHNLGFDVSLIGRYAITKAIWDDKEDALELLMIDLIETRAKLDNF